LGVRSGGWSLAGMHVWNGSNWHISEMALVLGDVRSQGDIVAKVFWGVERKFLEPLMRFTRGDVRDRIASSKIDHGPSWRL
jgi:hypothetical protein